jgi:RNA exonuclease 4
VLFVIQVTDARATMAIYRLYRKEWEKGMRSVNELGSTSKKRNRLDSPNDDGGEGQSGSFPGGGKRGVSSGLSTVITRGSGAVSGGSEKRKWWKELGGSSGKSKGSLKLQSS